VLSFQIYALAKFPRRVDQIRVFAVNTHPLKTFSTKKRNTLEQGDMFMVKVAAPPSHDRLRQDGHARTDN